MRLSSRENSLIKTKRSRLKGHHLDEDAFKIAFFIRPKRNQHTIFQRCFHHFSKARDCLLLETVAVVCNLDRTTSRQSHFFIVPSLPWGVINDNHNDDVVILMMHVDFSITRSHFAAATCYWYPPVGINHPMVNCRRRAICISSSQSMTWVTRRWNRFLWGFFSISQRR